jgi:hypothetical protein
LASYFNSGSLGAVGGVTDADGTPAEAIGIAIINVAGITGALYYDADGSGTGSSAVQVALIGSSTHSSLAVTDIQIGN